MAEVAENASRFLNQALGDLDWQEEADFLAGLTSGLGSGSGGGGGRGKRGGGRGGGLGQPRAPRRPQKFRGTQTARRPARTRAKPQMARAGSQTLRARPRPPRDIPPLNRHELHLQQEPGFFPVMEVPEQFLAAETAQAGRSHLQKVPKGSHRTQQSQVVNELLRDKLAQSIDTMDKIKSLLGTVHRRKKFIHDLVREMKELLDTRITPGILCSQARMAVRQSIPNLRVDHAHPLHQEQTSHTQTQLEIFVAQHDGLGTKLEENIQAELTDLGYAVQKLEGLLKYGHELMAQLERLEKQFSDYLKYIAYTVKTDRECLKHTRVTPDLPMTARQPVLGVKLEELLPLPQLLELQEWAMQSTKGFHKTARDCVREESAKAKQEYLATKLTLRALISDSVALKREMEEAVMLLHNQQPMLGKKERELKEALASKLAPLQVCKQRYQIRLQREGSEHVDEVQEALKVEVDQLAGEVGHLQHQLDAIREQMRICRDKEALLCKYIDVQIEHIAVHNDLVNMEDSYFNRNKKKTKTKRLPKAK